MAAVVVVGGGLAGLAAAARLARQRHEVRLLDAHAPGERQAPADEPASFTLPAVYRDLFRKTGRPLEPDVRLVPVDPARRYVFPDGRVLDLPTANRAAMLEAFGRGLGGRAANEWDAFVTWGGAMWGRLRHRLAPEGETSGSIDPTTFRSRLRDPANRLVLDWYAIDAGIDPASATEHVAVLPYLEQAFGAWRVDGGLGVLAAATARRARRCGATLEGGTEVMQVLVRDGEVTGVLAADGSTVHADVVVDTAGVPVRPAPASPSAPAGPATVTLHVLAAEPPDLPVETVLLPRAGGRGIVVARPDVAVEPSRVLVRGAVPAALAAGEEAELARRLLDAVNRAGVDLRGEVIGVSVRPLQPTPRARRWPRRSMPGWLDLRDGLAVPDVDGLLLAVSQVRGGLAVPWQGLVAALAASGCGTAPRRRPG